MGFAAHPRRVTPPRPDTDHLTGTRVPPVPNRPAPAPAAATDRSATAGPGRAAGTGTGRAGAPVLTARALRDRPADLLAAVSRLDARLDARSLRDLSDWLRETYAVQYGLVPLGLVAVCRLGPPYVDHRMSLDMVIIDHFAAADPMPEPFGAARMLARSGSYAFVEVYPGGLVLPVLDDGAVVGP